MGRFGPVEILYIQYQPAELLRHCYYWSRKHFVFLGWLEENNHCWELFQIGLRLMLKCVQLCRALQHSPTSGYILIVRCSIFFGILSSVLRAYPSPFFAIGRWACFFIKCCTPDRWIVLFAQTNWSVSLHLPFDKLSPTRNENFLSAKHTPMPNCVIFYKPI